MTDVLALATDGFFTNEVSSGSLLVTELEVELDCIDVELQESIEIEINDGIDIEILEEIEVEICG